MNGESLFTAASFAFRILEYDDTFNCWQQFWTSSISSEDYRDGYAMRQHVLRLNSDYAAKGRKFKLMRQPRGDWEEATAE